MKGENIGVPLQLYEILLLGSMEIYSQIYITLVEEDCMNLVIDFWV